MKGLFDDDVPLFKKTHRTLMSDGPEKLEAEIYCDGASSGNPGHAGIGVVIKVVGKPEETRNISEYIGKTTNNVAEYSALLRGIKEALSMGFERVALFLDSELLVKQIKKIYKIKSENLRPLWEEAVKNLAKFDSYKLIHIKREMNNEADLLAKRASRNSGKLI